MPEALTPAQLFDICGSSTVSEAAAKGDRLGWPRLTGPPLDEWRNSFIAYNGGTVEVVTWRREAQGGDDLLSFWIARGRNGHRACAYSTGSADGLLDALSEHFGTPATIDRYDFGTTAFWKRGTTEVSFSQVGSSATINISSAN